MELANCISMKKTGWVWIFYKLIFLDFWHRRFFNVQIKPQDLDFGNQQKVEYLNLLGLKINLLDSANQPLGNLPSSPTLFYGDHPSSLDAMYVYFALFGRRLWFVSFLHNQLHFKFLKIEPSQWHRDLLLKNSRLWG